MKKKGFTLIEMMAVLVVLILLTLAIVPNVVNLVANKKDTVSSQTMQLIYSAADLYVNENNGFVNEEGNIYCIKLGTLVEDDKLKKPITDFKTGNEISLENMVKVTVNKYEEYEYQLTNTCTSQLVNQYKEEILNGSDPKLYTNMIPVTFDVTGNVVKANLEEEWYKYEEQEWANAVTVTEASRDTYKAATAGTVIATNDINGYYVWIPKYEYKMVASQTARVIQINFVASGKTKPSKGYKIHPSFHFNNDDLDGYWVSKFEASSDDTATLCNTTTGNATCNVTTNNALFIPGVSSWRYIAISNAFTVVRNMEKSGNIYGLSSAEVDTHLMKNSEWGAVAYLSYSVYGKYGNSIYDNNSKEVSINNRSYITGLSNTGTSYVDSITASTTGNIYGIYDMNGGSNEYVMGNYNNEKASSSFSSLPGTYYYNLYNSATLSDACGTICYGEALSETKGWFDDSSTFVTSITPWLVRGGSYASDNLSGVFAYLSVDGAPDLSTSFRATIINN